MPQTVNTCRLRKDRTRVTVDKLSAMYIEIYESSDTRPAGKMQAIIGLAKLHGFF